MRPSFLDCTLCVGTEGDAVNVHRGYGLSGAPSSRILRTHPRGLGMPGLRGGHYRVPCPRLPQPRRFGSFWFGTLDDARSRLAGRGRPHGPPSVLDRGGVHPMASARRERGPNSRYGVGRVHAWRVGTDELISVAHAPQAHGRLGCCTPNASATGRGEIAHPHPRYVSGRSAMRPDRRTPITWARCNPRPERAPRLADASQATGGLCSRSGLRCPSSAEEPPCQRGPPEFK